MTHSAHIPATNDQKCIVTYYRRDRCDSILRWVFGMSGSCQGSQFELAGADSAKRRACDVRVIESIVNCSVTACLSYACEAEVQTEPVCMYECATEYSRNGMGSAGLAELTLAHLYSGLGVSDVTDSPAGELNMRQTCSWSQCHSRTKERCAHDNRQTRRRSIYMTLDWRSSRRLLLRRCQRLWRWHRC